MGIVNEYAEIVFLLESGNLVKYAHCAGHSVNAFGYQENSSSIFIGFLAGPCQNLFAINTGLHRDAAGTCICVGNNFLSSLLRSDQSSANIRFLCL